MWVVDLAADLLVCWFAGLRLDLACCVLLRWFWLFSLGVGCGWSWCGLGFCGSNACS